MTTCLVANPRTSFPSTLGDIPLDVERGPCGDVLPNFGDVLAPDRGGRLGDFDDDEDLDDDSISDIVRPIGDAPAVEEEDDFDEDDFDDDFDDDFESYDYEEEIVEEGTEVAEESDADLERVLAGESMDDESADVPIEEIVGEDVDKADADDEEEDDEEEFDDE